MSKDTVQANAVLDPLSPPRQTANVLVGVEALEVTLRDNNASHPLYLATDADITSTMEGLAGSATYVPYDPAAPLWARLHTVRFTGVQEGWT